MELMFEQLNPHACKTYLIGEKNSKKVIFVDPVLDHLEDYVKLLKDRKLTLTHILETHTHADHISGAAALKDITGADYVMHKNAPAKCANIRVEQGSTLKIGNIEIKVIHTPGHTKDSVSYVFNGKVLTGDALFLDEGGAGRDDLPGGNPADHWESLQRILKLPEEVVVYPAHEYRNRNPSALKQQKQTNPFLKIKTKDDYVEFLTQLKLGPAEWMKDVLKANYSCARDPKAAWIPVDAPSCEVKGTLAKGVNDQIITPISPIKLKQKIQQMKGAIGKDLLLLDVREPFELTAPPGKIEGVMNIPIGKLILNLDKLEPFKNKEIISICRSGHRASTAAQILQQAGFKKILVLDGGMIAWSQNSRN